MTIPKKTDRSEKELLSEDEQKKLCTYLEDNQSASNAGILLSYATGIRIGELCALKWSEVDLEKRIITVKSTMQRIKDFGGVKSTKVITTSPKSGSSVREIPIPDFIVPLLERERSESDCYILTGTQKVAEPRTIQYRFKSILKRLNLKNVSFHSLRHMFATKCISLGFDIKTLSEILGHSSVEITLNRYVHSSIKRKAECMKLFSDNFALKSF